MKTYDYDLILISTLEKVGSGSTPAINEQEARGDICKTHRMTHVGHGEYSSEYGNGNLFIRIKEDKQ